MKELFLAMMLMASSTLGFSQSNANVPLLVAATPLPKKSLSEFDHTTCNMSLMSTQMNHNGAP